MICRDRGSVDAVAYTRYTPSYNELRCRTSTGGHSRDLDDDADNHDSSTEEDGPAATEVVTEREDEAGTEEAADSVDRDDETFVGTVAVDLGEVRGEGRGRDDTGHDALIVTEQQEISRSNGGNQPLHAFAGDAPVVRDALGVVCVTHLVVSSLFFSRVDVDERGSGLIVRKPLSWLLLISQFLFFFALLLSVRCVGVSRSGLEETEWSQILFIRGRRGGLYRQPKSMLML